MAKARAEHGQQAEEVMIMMFIRQRRGKDGCRLFSFR